MSLVPLLKEFLPRWKDTHDKELTILRRMDSDFDSIISVLHDTAGADHELYYTHYEEHDDSIPGEIYETKTVIAFTKKGNAYHMWYVELIRSDEITQILEPKHISLDPVCLPNFLWEDVLEEVLKDRLPGMNLPQMAAKIAQTHLLWKNGLFEKCYEPARIQRIMDLGGMEAVTNYLG